MVPNKPHCRVNTLELKAHVIRKIGQQKADKYFSLLKRFFSYRISKSDFDSLCIRTIGREAIPLHNQLIRSILKNASISSSPPTKKAGTKIATKDTNGYQMNCFKSLYGDAFPPSPRKVRSSVCRDKKLRDRPSPLGPLGKPQSILAAEETSSRAHEQQSAAELISIGSRPPLEVVSVEDGEEVEQITGSPGVQSRSPVTAPFGVSVNSLGPKKTLPIMSVSGGTRAEICRDGGQLPDTQSLRNCLLKKLEAEGMKVSVDCANLLNNALDAYLKRLIEPCIALAKSRRENIDRSKMVSIVNGRFVRKEHVDVSMVDFSAAMELNPQLLGEDWATQLERISLLTLYGS